jgi:hypothetical protein
MQLRERLFCGDADLPPEVVSRLVSLLILLVKSRCGGLSGIWDLFVVFFVRVEGFSALVRLNSTLFVALKLLELRLKVILHLSFVHVFYFLNDEIGNRSRTSIRIVVIIDVHIVVVYDLNDLGRVALSHRHVTQAHCFQLLLDFGTVLRGGFGRATRAVRQFLWPVGCFHITCVHILLFHCLLLRIILKNQ